MSLDWLALEHAPLAALVALDHDSERTWEQEVIVHLRELSEVEPPEFALVGYDSFGPVVIINYVIYEAICTCKILAVATALRAQRRGYGAEALAHVLDLLESGHHGEIEAVIGVVHRRNVYSKAMMTGCGLMPDRPISEVLELWSRPVSRQA